MNINGTLEKCVTWKAAAYAVGAAFVLYISASVATLAWVDDKKVDKEVYTTEFASQKEDIQEIKEILTACLIKKECD